MAASGIEGILIETHNWGKTVSFWKALSFELEFETDHHSGQLRHPAGGPYLFVAERPPEKALTMQLMMCTSDPQRFDPPTAGSVESEFSETHWGALEMALRDPDDRRVSIQTPPEAHGS